MRRACLELRILGLQVSRCSGFGVQGFVVVRAF